MLILLVTSVILGVYLGFKLILIWLPFIFAWWISNLLSPIVEGIHKKIKLNKSLLTFIILLIFVSISLLIISLIGYAIVTQAQSLLVRFPEMSEVMKTGAITISENLVQFTSFLPNLLTENLDIDVAKILENINLSVTTILASLVGIVAFIPNFLISIIVMCVAAFFMTKDKYKLKDIEMKIWSNKIFRTPLMVTVKSDVIMVLLGYLKAQIILMVLTFTEVAIGLSLLKIPNAILIALGIGLLDALPVFGTGSVFIPWVIISLFYQDYGLALGIFIVYLIATLGRQSLEPKIISTQIGVYPLITLLTIYTGIKVFGILGIIIAPFTVISIMAIKKSGILKFN
jgi:sporulation integral membrane protein YtvI